MTFLVSVIIFVPLFDRFKNIAVADLKVVYLIMVEPDSHQSVTVDPSTQMTLGYADMLPQDFR